RNIPSPTLPRSDWAAPESWAVDGTGPKDEDYSSESDDGLTPSTALMGSSLPGRSDSIAASVNTMRVWKPPGSAGSGAYGDGALNGGGLGRVGAEAMNGSGASVRGDRRLNSAGSMRSYAPTLGMSFRNEAGTPGPGGMGPRGSEATVSKNWPASFNVRVYRTDGTYHVVSCPLHATVSEMQHVLGRKLNLPRESHRLHLWERNRERALANQERPALIMRRRLEQAGYDDIDQLETIGGEDLRFLLRFVYRSVDLGGPGIDEEELSFDTFERVDLTGRGLPTVPILLHRHASTITFLNLSKNPLVDLPLDFIQGCDELRELPLPASLGTLTSLTVLSCTNNELAGLPDSIGALQKLNRLNIRNNNVREVPVGIWYCEALQEINCSSNLLQLWPDPPVPNGERKGSGAGLPDSGAGASTGTSNAAARPLPLALSLQRLLLADNQLLDDVFHPLAVLRDLRVLNLSFNQISEMPSFRLQTFAQLEELYLSGNRLTSFPADDLERLQKLNVLFLNANKLQTLPAELRKVKKLTSLDVGSNVLKYNMANYPFDWNWAFNRELRYLNLSGNKRLVIKPLDVDDKTNAHTNNLRPGEKPENGFAVLRDIRVLGLIDATVLVPSVPDESDDRRVRTSLSEINGMAYGISDSLGKLEQLNTFDLAVPHFRGRENECLFGIFGRAAPVANSNRLAKYLHENFSQTLLGFLGSLKLDRSESTPDALRRTFLSLNKTLYDYLLPPTSSVRKMSQASTVAATKAALDPASLKASAAACVVYFVDKTMYVANVGSSLAVISRLGTPYELSRKHDPFDRIETIRIRAAEGWVSPKGFVNDELDCDESRAFGVYHLLPAVNARPDVQTWQLTDQDERQ
ncbi:cysteinyl-tRNA synthetase, partial [Ceratobasidium sp. 394]